MNDKEQIKRLLEEHNIVRINSGMTHDMFGNMLEMEEEGTGGTHSFPITDPSLIQELDSLTPPTNGETGQFPRRRSSRTRTKRQGDES